MTAEGTALSAAIVLAGRPLDAHGAAQGVPRVGRRVPAGTHRRRRWPASPPASWSCAPPARRCRPCRAAVEIVDDARPGRGPLEGLLAGLRVLERRDDAAFVCATDMPLLHPRLVARVAALLRPHDDAAVPEVAGRRHPLAGVYRARLAPRIAARLDAGLLSLMGLLDACGARSLDAATLLADAVLARDDPRLESLVNLNTPDQLRREKATRDPAAPSSSSRSQASAVAPASEVTA